MSQIIIFFFCCYKKSTNHVEQAGNNRSTGTGMQKQAGLENRLSPHEWFTCTLTGIPAGRKRSRLWTGMMKQSLSSVASEIGSLRELTNPPLPGCPPKLTVPRVGPQMVRKFICGAEFCFLGFTAQDDTRCEMNSFRSVQPQPPGGGKEEKKMDR